MQLRQMFNEIEPELQKVDNYLLTSLDNGHESLRTGFMHLLRAGGKRIRPAFILLSARYGKEKTEKIVPIAAAFEMVHMASLVHDDVVDHSELRRGEPTIRALYGNNFSLHLGDYLFAKALSIIDEYKNPRLNNLLAYASVEMCRGEIEQIGSAFNYQENIRNYFYRIKRKTSLLITLSCEAGALVGGAEPPVIRTLGRYGHYIGMAFQITDDVLDYVADEKTLGKPVGSDIQQGIMTLPVIYALKYGQLDLRREILEILHNKPLKKEDIATLVSLIKDSEAINHSLGLVNRFVDKALKQLEMLPDNQTTCTLRQIARFIHQRNY